MEAFSGGELFVFHARVVRDDMPAFGVKLAVPVGRKDLEQLRKCVKQHYEAETVYLSYEEKY